MNNENIKKSNIEIINAMIEKLENRRNDLHLQYEAIKNTDLSNVNKRWLQFEQEEINKKALDKIETMTYISGKIDTLRLVKEMLIANNQEWKIEMQYKNMISNLIHSI